MNARKPPSIHDKFFRAAMKNPRVAIDFIQHHFPKDICLALDTKTLKLIPNSYISDELQETVSDLVFSCKIASKQAYISLLIEHQSTPDKMMPFRVYHYLFGLLHDYRKQYPKKKLPPVYTLVFYHGKQTPYPHSLLLKDCFDDPLNIMSKVLYQKLPLIDANQLSDEELKKQHWIGPMLTAMKYIRKKDMTEQAIEILSSIMWNTDNQEEKSLLKLLLNYLFRRGNIQTKVFTTQARTQQLPHSIRRNVMTLAEQLQQEGRIEGKLEGIQEKTKDIAIKLLTEGSDIAFVHKITGLSIAEVEQLKQH